ncbi:hypothetical protein BVX98_01080 [bacterium F11]|nr:hypothetical protein BVX98_01080 [bacterium F11]
MDDVTGFKTDSGQISDLIELFGQFGVSDTFKFGQIVGPNGQNTLLFEDQYQAWLTPRQPKPPRIQANIKQAAELQKRLDDTPGLTQTALARELGMDRTTLIRLLNLTWLSPAIKDYINRLGPDTLQCPLTKKHLRQLTTIQDSEIQTEKFSQLIESLKGDYSKNTKLPTFQILSTSSRALSLSKRSNFPGESGPTNRNMECLALGKHQE